MCSNCEHDHDHHDHDEPAHETALTNKAIIAIFDRVVDELAEFGQVPIEKLTRHIDEVAGQLAAEKDVPGMVGIKILRDFMVGVCAESRAMNAMHLSADQTTILLSLADVDAVPEKSSVPARSKRNCAACSMPSSRR